MLMVKNILRKRRRQGMTMIETIVALLLMAMAILVIGRLTSARIAETEILESQYSAQAVDAFMYGIYQDYHKCLSFDIVDDPIEDEAGNLLRTLTKSISFDLGTGGANIYSYDRETGKCYVNGSEVFKCESFVAQGTSQFLYVAVKLQNQKILEFQIYP